MDLAIVGTGYVGLVSGVAFAEMGHNVLCIDQDTEKILQLKNSIMPIYELGLAEVASKNRQEGRLDFTTSLAAAVNFAKVIFICVGTPSLPGGAADLSQIEAVARGISKYMREYKIIVNKSTVPVGSGYLVKQIIRANLPQAIDFDVVSVPEFLREGCALPDALQPERIIIGSDREQAGAILQEIFKPWGAPIVRTDLKSAELIKYASNAFLATKISFINEIANLCERVGADIKAVAQGMGLDSRIGSKFLEPGLGYGGSCLPKDTKALVHLARNNGYMLRILEAAIATNETQPLTVLSKLKKALPELENKTITVLGLTFKPNTDDLRDSPAIKIVRALLKEGANVKAYDPVAMAGAAKILTGLTFSASPYQAMENSDAVLLLTEWNEFRQLDLKRAKSLLNKAVFIDGRNLFEPSVMREIGFEYYCVGRR